jgi:hypothetical protein
MGPVRISPLPIDRRDRDRGDGTQNRRTQRAAGPWLTRIP